MPYINIKTKQTIDPQVEEVLKRHLGQAIEVIPRKTEEWLMLSFQQELSMWFQGTDDPCAMVEVSIYGGAPADAYDQLTARLTDIVCAFFPLTPSVCM